MNMNSNKLSKHDSVRQTEITIEQIDADNTLSTFQKRKLKKRVLKQFYYAREFELEQKLELYQVALLAQKDVLLKEIALEAQAAILKLKEEHLLLMRKLGIKAHEDITNILIQLGEMTDRQLNEVRCIGMDEMLKNKIMEGIKQSFKTLMDGIMNGIETYHDTVKKNKPD